MERGLDQVKVEDIAAAAGVSARTFNNYFASKEEVLFPETDARIKAVVDAIETRRPDERPVDVLLRALRDTSEQSDDLTGRTARLRLRLNLEVPAVRGRGLQLIAKLSRQWGCDRHPDGKTVWVDLSAG